MEGLFQKPKSIDDILNVIRRTELGSRVVNKFLSSGLHEKVEFVSYPEALKKRLKAESSRSKPLGAAFITDGQSGQIFYDGEGELGVLSILVFHELIHCLDLNLWKVAQSAHSPLQSRKVIFQSECIAYSAQYEFQTELKKLFPTIDSYCRLRANDFPALDKRMTPSDIARLYLYPPK